MATLFQYLLLVIVGATAIPVSVLVVEIAAALISNKREPRYPWNVPRPGVCVLIPAHNESAGLRPTLEDIKAQLLGNDRLLVVADNCTDDTASIARAAGADVIERHDPAQIGKGFALDFGLKHLGGNPPAIVILVDADCRIAPDTIDRLSTACAATRRPVQALYLMTSPDSSSIKYHAAEFAWFVKNYVRPLGLSVFGLPCQLMGSGMAFPWKVIRSADLATSSIVEDLKLGLELAQTGAAPLFYPSAKVTSQFPQSVEGAQSQRERWETGHVRLLLAGLPAYLGSAIARGNLALLALALDLAVPPLSLLVMLVGVEFLVAGVASYFGAPLGTLALSAGCLAAIGSAVFLAWLKWGRERLPLSAFPSLATYVLGKLPVYRRIFSDGNASRWIRTQRGDDK